MHLHQGRTLLFFSLIAGAISVVPEADAQDLLNLNFRGHYRSKPKTSIVRRISTDAISTPTHYASLANLLAVLPNDASMRQKYPDLNKPKTGFPQKRETEELRNVEVDCWIHAVKFEDGRQGKPGDNDLHVIIGSLPDTSESTYMTAEVSGLPASGKNRPVLKDARAKFLQIVQGLNPGTSFKQVFPAKKVRITGSLFFDGDHRAGCPSCPGPAWAKPESVWEIHPVYAIVEIQ